MKALGENFLPQGVTDLQDRHSQMVLGKNNACTLFLVDKVLYTFGGGWGLKQVLSDGLVRDVKDVSSACGGSSDVVPT